MLTIGRLAVEPPLLLAPMAGITDSAFRRVVRQAGGCGLVTVDMVASEAVIRGVAKELAKLRFRPEERPLSIQVSGARPEAMAVAAAAVEAAGADACDVNMGCPARDVVSAGAGAALMGNLDLARRILAAMRPRLGIPLTVKLRSGLREGQLNDLELGRICEGEGVDAVTLHPRTARQQYAGSADWSRIARLKEALSIPVIGNGDVCAAADVQRMLRSTGCDGVMIGRAALVDPWIFRQAARVLAGQLAAEASLEERIDLVRRHLAILVGELEGQALLHRLRLLTRWCSRGLPGGRRLRQRLSVLQQPDALQTELEGFLEHCACNATTLGPAELEQALPISAALGR
jgi:tRNA-dihydrouridine synthase B